MSEILGIPAQHPYFADMEQQYGKIGCLLAGPGRGDCEHFVGMPSVLDESATDVYGRPIGWCMPCWTSVRLAASEARVSALTAALAPPVSSEGFICLGCGEWAETRADIPHTACSLSDEARAVLAAADRQPADGEGA